MRLPGELRNAIYTHALGGRIVQMSECLRHGASTDERSRALLRVSRQVHVEAEKIPYVFNVFHCGFWYELYIPRPQSVSSLPSLYLQKIIHLQHDTGMIAPGPRVVQSRTFLFRQQFLREFFKRALHNLPALESVTVLVHISLPHGKSYNIVKARTWDCLAETISRLKDTRVHKVKITMEVVNKLHKELDP